MKVAIIGASDKPDRYAHKAQKMLMDHGHETFPVSLSGKEILGRTGYRSALEIPEADGPIHTATLYVSPDRFAPVADEVIDLKPERVIFNPGTESAEIEQRFRDAGIEVVEACTLVLLATDQFEAA